MTTGFLVTMGFVVAILDLPVVTLIKCVEPFAAGIKMKLMDQEVYLY